MRLRANLSSIDDARHFLQFSSSSSEGSMQEFILSFGKTARKLIGPGISMCLNWKHFGVIPTSTCSNWGLYFENAFQSHLLVIAVYVWTQGGAPVKIIL